MKRLLPVLLVLACAAAVAQVNPVVRLRGSIESVEPQKLVFKERSGKSVALVLPDEVKAVEVLPTDISRIQPGAFIGTAAMPRPDGTLESLEVVVFPEAARGTGEGHYPWDLKPDSTMTNATVADLVRSADGRTLTLRYKDGEKKVVIPEGVPVVTFRPGDRSLLVPGARAFIVAEPADDGTLVIRRLLVGRNGFQPPM
ncbi:MAG TPA: hypothetical protein VHA15_13340 [Burkholderiales bacterium]|nr:hypothetical protein [Burkholderiales bacterium]